MSEEEAETRENAMKALKRHKSGWIGLGKSLVEIKAKDSWKDWGYDKFWDYTKIELGLTIMTAKEMMTAYEYIKNNEPATLNTLDRDDSYIPDYHTLASLSKASESHRINDEKEDTIRDILFNGEDSAAASNKKAKDLLSELNKKDGETIMEDIKKKTKNIKGRVKKLNNDIQSASSFDNTILETSDRLNEMVSKVVI